MNTEMLTGFFMWCTIINGGIYLLWVIFITGMPDFVYRVQSRWFSISREVFDVVIYAFLGLFKLFFIVFNVTPYLALLILNQ